MILDVNPVSLPAGAQSSMPLRVPGWFEGPGRNEYLSFLAPGWLASDFEASSTSPVRAFGDQALFFVIDDKPLAVVLRPSTQPSHQGHISASSIGDRLDVVKERLSLTVTQLAELFGVTRKTVYDWYEGAEPRQAMIGRLVALQEVLEEREGMNLARLKAFWNVPVAGSSFLSTLRNDTLSGPELKAELLAKLNGLSDEMDAPARRSAHKAGYLRESAISDIERRTDSMS